MKKTLSIFLVLLVISCKKSKNSDITESNDPYIIENASDIYNYNTGLSRWQRWIYEGDSITDVLSNADNYPNQLTILNASIKNTQQINVAKPSDMIMSMVTDYYSQVYPQRSFSTGSKYIFAVMAGTNDANNDRTPEQIYDNLKTEWKQARNDNFTVVAFCITPSTEQKRNKGVIAVNKLIISDTTLYDYLIRTDLILPDPANTNLFYDGLHPTKLGNILIAKNIIKTLSKK